MAGHYRTSQNQIAPPCDGCPLAQRCASDKLACRYFVYWRGREVKIREQWLAVAWSLLRPLQPTRGLWKNLHPKPTPLPLRLLERLQRAREQSRAEGRAAVFQE